MERLCPFKHLTGSGIHISPHKLDHRYARQGIQRIPRPDFGFTRLKGSHQLFNELLKPCGSRFFGINVRFASGWLMDSTIVAAFIRTGESVDSAQLLELCSGARTLFSLATLVGRGTDKILDNHHLWADTLETFRKSLAASTQVPTDHDPILRFHLQQQAWTRQR
jgi:hypothetical protein